MADVELAELSWVCISGEEDGDPEEIFFRAQDIVKGLRRQAQIHLEAEDEYPQLHQAFSFWLTQEADAYDVAIMQALLDHEEKADD